MRNLAEQEPVADASRSAFSLWSTSPRHDASALRGEFHPEWIAKLVLDTGIAHTIEHGSWTRGTAFLRKDGREVFISQVILLHLRAGGPVDYLSTIAPAT